MRTCPFCRYGWNGTRFCANCGKDLSDLVASDGGYAALDRFEWRPLPNGKYKIVGLNVLYDGPRANELAVPDRVELIAPFACSDRRELTSLDLGDGVKTLETGAFENCMGLKRVHLGRSLQTIGADAFSWCLGLETITIPACVKTVGERAFDHCTGLRSLTVERGVERISADAFRECEALREVTLPRGIRYEKNSFPARTVIKFA